MIISFLLVGISFTYRLPLICDNPNTTPYGYYIRVCLNCQCLFIIFWSKHRCPDYIFILSVFFYFLIFSLKLFILLAFPMTPHCSFFAVLTEHIFHTITILCFLNNLPPHINKELLPVHLHL